ncbi:MAG: lysophospholipid acyltransferase family protein [Pseudomonadota bacterium]
MMHFLRSLLFHILFVAATAYVLIFYGIASYFAPAMALKGFRTWAKLVIWGLKAFVNITIEIRGAEYLPKGGALVACKHQSTLETALLFAIFQNPSIILKRELLYIPFANAMIKGAKHIAINRRGHGQEKRRIVTHAMENIQNGHQIIIFPEGTRSSVTSSPSYKRGIFSIYTALKVPCLPVALNTGMFWGRRSFYLNPGNVIIELLPPIQPGLKDDDFMTTLRTNIEAASARLIQEAAFEQSQLRRGTHPSQSKPKYPPK